MVKVEFVFRDQEGPNMEVETNIQTEHANMVEIKVSTALSVLADHLFNDNEFTREMLQRFRPEIQQRVNEKVSGNIPLMLEALMRGHAEVDNGD